MSAAPAIPVIARRPMSEGEPEYREMAHYESGLAEEQARAVPGVHAEPWLNVLDERESDGCSKMAITRAGRPGQKEHSALF